MPTEPQPMLLEPQSSLPLTHADHDMIRTLIHRERRVSRYNVTRCPERKNERGYAVHGEVVALLVGAQPHEGVRPEDSRIMLSDGREAYLHLRMKEGLIAGFKEAQLAREYSSNLLVYPRDGYAWVVDPEGDALPARIDADIERIHALDHFGGQENTSLRGAKPFAIQGELFNQGIAITRVTGFDDPAISIHAHRAEKADEAYRERLEIARRHLGPDLMLDLLSLSKDCHVTPPKNDAQRFIWEQSLYQAIYGMLREFKKNGMLSACPNNGPRAIHELEGWDAWVSSDDDTPRLDDLPWKMGTICWSPVFKTTMYRYFNASYDLYPSAEDAPAPDAPSPGADPDFDRKAAAIISEAVTQFIASDRITLGTSIDLNSKLGVERVKLQSSQLNPVLVQYDRSYGKAAVLDPMEVPKPLRHVMLPVPSGRLFVADWARIKGFNEAIDALCEDHNINTNTGLTAQQKDLYEKLGALKIQVGNTSPAAYQVSEGVWRAGRVDEDQFFNEDDDTIDVPYEESWKTCTDLWANLYIDVDQLTSVLMSSGEYESEGSALTAIKTYMEETYGASIIDIGAGELHFYVPNGDTGLDENMMSNLCEELEDYGFDPEEEWNDHYFIARSPLPVPDELLISHDWVPAGPLVGLRKAMEADEPGL